MNDELLNVITKLKGLVTDGPELVDIYDTVHSIYFNPADRSFTRDERLVLRDAVYRYAHVDQLSDWLPVGTPKGWVLGELDRLAEFVTGDDT
jgi:hypothetical protein